MSVFAFADDKLRLDPRFGFEWRIGPGLFSNQRLFLDPLRYVSTGFSGQPLDTDPDYQTKGFDLEELYYRLLDGYSKTLPVCGRSKCYASNGDTVYRSLTEHYQSFTDEQLYALTGETEFNKSYAVILRGFHEVSQTRTERGFFQVVAKYRQKLPRVEDKLLFISFVMREVHRGYDSAREDATYLGKGVVKTGEMFEVIRNRYRGFNATQASLNAGVCRDMHVLGGLAAQAMGFSNVYLVAFSRLGAYHTNLIFEIPEAQAKGELKRKIVRMNYEEMIIPLGADGVALYDPKGLDDSLDYRIFLPQGKMVKSVQSPFGKFLAEASGFDVVELNPVAHANSSLLAGNLKLDQAGNFRVRFGYGSDETNASYLFVSGSASWGNFDSMPGRLALTVAQQEKSFYDGRKISTAVLYSRIDQWFKSKKFELNDKLRIQASLLASLYWGYSQSNLDKKEDNDSDQVSEGSSTGIQRGNIQGDAHFIAKIDLEKEFSETSSVQAAAGFEVVPGISDIRNNYWLQMPIPVWNQLFFTVQGRKKLSATPGGRVMLFAVTTLVLDQLGSRFLSEAGLVGPKFSSRLYVQGRITGPSFIEGSVYRVGLKAQIVPNDFISVGFDGSMAVEDTGYGPDARVFTFGEAKF